MRDTTLCGLDNTMTQGAVSIDKHTRNSANWDFRGRGLNLYEKEFSGILSGIRRPVRILHLIDQRLLKPLSPYTPDMNAKLLWERWWILGKQLWIYFMRSILFRRCDNSTQRVTYIFHIIFVKFWTITRNWFQYKQHALCSWLLKYEC
jgi:hypothetical protein